MRAEPVLNELERVEWRVQGALRAVDVVTGTTVHEYLEVTADDARIVRNRSGLWVIHEWSRLIDHASAFSEPPPPPPGGPVNLNVRIRDPRQIYLQRQVMVALPRNPDAEDDTSLYAPVLVQLYPSPNAELGTNWCDLRAVVSDVANDDRLGGALLRVEAGGQVLARGMTDWRGEAFIPVAGVPVTTWSEDETVVVVTEIAATLHVYFDTNLGTRLTEADLLAGYTPALNELPLVNPDNLDARRNTLPTLQQDISLAARGRVQVELALDLT